MRSKTRTTLCALATAGVLSARLSDWHERTDVLHRTRIRLRTAHRRHTAQPQLAKHHG